MVAQPRQNDKYTFLNMWNGEALGSFRLSHVTCLVRMIHTLCSVGLWASVMI